MVERETGLVNYIDVTFSSLHAAYIIYKWLISPGEFSCKQMYTSCNSAMWMQSMALFAQLTFVYINLSTLRLNGSLLVVKLWDWCVIIPRSLFHKVWGFATFLSLLSCQVKLHLFRSFFTNTYCFQLALR